MTERGDANLTFKSAEELKVEIAAELGKEPICRDECRDVAHSVRNAARFFALAG